MEDLSAVGAEEFHGHAIAELYWVQHHVKTLVITALLTFVISRHYFLIYFLHLVYPVKKVFPIPI